MDPDSWADYVESRQIKETEDTDPPSKTASAKHGPSDMTGATLATTPAGASSEQGSPIGIVLFLLVTLLLAG